MSSPFLDADMLRPMTGLNDIIEARLRATKEAIEMPRSEFLDGYRAAIDHVLTVMLPLERDYQGSIAIQKIRKLMP